MSSLGPGRMLRSTIASGQRKAEAVVAEISALGRQAVLIDGDVFERESCESVAHRAVEAFGHIDIFVSNPPFRRGRSS